MTRTLTFGAPEVEPTVEMELPGDTTAENAADQAAAKLGVKARRRTLEVAGQKLPRTKTLANAGLVDGDEVLIVPD